MCVSCALAKRRMRMHLNNGKNKGMNPASVGFISWWHQNGAANLKKIYELLRVTTHASFDLLFFPGHTCLKGEVSVDISVLLSNSPGFACLWTCIVRPGAAVVSQACCAQIPITKLDSVLFFFLHPAADLVLIWTNADRTYNTDNNIDLTIQCFFSHLCL